MGGLGDRPTGDLVLLGLMLMLGALLLCTIAGLVALTIARPDLDLTVAINQLGNTTSALTGSVLGYVAGRRAAAVPLPDK